MAVQQNKALGMVANTMTITKLVNELKTRGVELKMIQSLWFAAHRYRHEKGRASAACEGQRNAQAMDAAGEINAAWNKWLGPNTEFKMTRTDKVTPLSELKFDPIP